MVFYAFQQFHMYDLISANKVGGGVRNCHPKRPEDLHQVKHKSMAAPRLLEPRCPVS